MFYIAVNKLAFSHQFHNDYIIICGEIFIEINGVFFPSKHWNDLTSSILDMWATEVLSLVTRKSKICQLYFMDGPYHLDLRVNTENNVQISCIQEDSIVYTTEIRLNEILFSLINALEKFTADCHDLSVDVAHSKTYLQLMQRIQDLRSLTKG